MKHLFRPLCAALLLALPFATLAQTGVTIGATTAPDASAALDIISTSKGVLLPRVADATAIASPATGLIVFQTGGTAGYYYNAGTPTTPNWQQLATATGAAITASNGLTKTGQNVALGGSLSGPTTIAQGGNSFSLTGGNVGIGATAPGQKLDVTGGSIRIGTSGSGLIFPDGTTQTTAATTATGAGFIQNQTASAQTGGFNISGNGTVGGTLSAATATVAGTTTTANAVVTTALTGSGATIGTTVGLGIRADGGLNLGQNTSDNFFVGYLAGRDNTTGVTNYAVGIRAGERTTTGNYNVFLGSAAGQFNTTGGQNLYMGWLAGQVSNGDRNFAIGMQAGRANTASDNHFVGFYAGTGTNTGSRNTFEGNYTGVNNTSGGRNTFVGYQAGTGNVDGSNNFGFGHMAGPSSGSLTNAGAIGYNAAVSQSNSLVLGGTGTDAVKVGIGTTAPAQKLDVTGGSIQISTAGQGLIFPDATTQTTAATTSTASNGLTKTGNNIALGGSLTIPTTIAQAGNNLALTGGSVGIGTAAPAATLDVSGDFRVSTGAVNSTLGTTGSGNANFNGPLGQTFTLPVAASITSIRLVCGSTGFTTTFQIYSGAGPSGTALLATPQSITFVANSSTTAVLTTPLSVAAGVYTVFLNAGSTPLRYFNGGENYTGGNVYSNSSSVAPYDLDFTVAYTSGSATSAFAVATGGNVGIGTSGTPAQKLDVTGGSIQISTAGQGLIFPDATTQTTAATATSFIQNQTASTQTGGFKVSGAGTVGGILTTGAGLVVNSGGVNTGTIANGLRFNGPNAGEGIGSKTDGGGNQSGLDFYTNSTAKLSISNGGNVGIGTTGAPAKRLHVNANNDVLRIDNLAQVSASNSYLVIDNVGNVGKTVVENVAGQLIRLGFNGTTYFENNTDPTLAESGLRFNAYANTTDMGVAPNGAANFINTITGATISTNQPLTGGNGTPGRTTDRIALPAGVYRVTVRLAGAYAGSGGSPSAFVKFVVDNNEYSFTNTLAPAGSSINTSAEVSDYINLSAASTIDFTFRPLRNFTIADRATPPGVGFSYRSLLLIERVR